MVEFSPYYVGTVRSPGSPEHGQPTLYVPEGSQMAKVLAAYEQQAAQDAVVRRREERTNNESRGTVGYVQRALGIAVRVSQEYASGLAEPSAHQASNLKRLELERKVAHRLPYEFCQTLPGAVEFLESTLDEGWEQLARARRHGLDADGALAEHIDAQQSVLSRLIDELPHLPEQS